MPNTKSALKELRKSRKRNLRNKRVKLKLKALIKEVRHLVLEKDRKRAELVLRKTIKALDKAAEDKYIKKNTAARKKSRLQRLVNKLSQRRTSGREVKASVKS